MATIIRAGEAGNLGARLGRIDLTDHLEEARRTVEAARREAEQIISEARREAERKYKETSRSGYDDGYRDGEQTGREVGLAQALADAAKRFEQEHDDLISDMRRVVEDVDAIKTDLRIAAGHDLLNFAVTIARKLTFAIGELNTESAAANMQRAIELIGRQADIRVRAHPRDLEAMRTFLPNLMDRAAKLGSIEFVVDESIAPGGCVVTHERSEIDATLETQAEELVTLLLGRQAVILGDADASEQLAEVPAPDHKREDGED
jgi:flagellar assembly protein FliH